MTNYRKIILSLGMHPHLINMDFKEGMVSKIYNVYTYTPQNIYTIPLKCI